MKKVLLNATLILAMGATSLAQSIGNLPVEQAKKQKHVLNPSNATAQPVLATRAEGDVIWSDDFSDATNWASTNVSAPPHGWTITTNLSAPPNATQTAPLIPVNFPTGANGYALCDSDGAGTTANPSQTNATITWSGSPIDCTNNPNVSLKFNAVTRNWSSQYFVRVSGDNGATWTEFPVLQEITTNVNTANSQEVSLNISSVAGGQSEVLIGFRYEAEWGWFWAVDDVELFETWNYDLVMNQTLNSVGAAGLKYTIYPVGQVIPDLKMGFGAQARNNGAMSMNPALRATQGAWSATGAQVSIDPNQTEDDSLSIADADGYTILSTVGTYNIELDLVTEETVQDPGAVESTFPFSVSPLIMAGDDYDGTDASMSGGFFGWAEATGDPGIGREFEINNAGVIGRVAVGIASVAAANQAEYLGKELYVELWKVVDGEPVFAGISEPHIVVASNFGNLAQCYFETPIAVNSGDIILAIAASGENDLVPVAFSGLHEAGSTTGKAGSEFVNLASDGEYVEVPVVRLDFGDYTGLTSNTLVAEDMAIYPNPAGDNASVRFTLTEEANVSIVVRDLSGKVVLTTESGFAGAGTYNQAIDLSAIAQGMYTVTLSANGAQVTQKMIKK
jgi:hypothetical protein